MFPILFPQLIKEEFFITKIFLILDFISSFSFLWVNVVFFIIFSFQRSQHVRLTDTYIRSKHNFDRWSFSRNLRRTSRIGLTYFLSFFFFHTAYHSYPSPTYQQEKIQYNSHGHIIHEHSRVGRSAIKALNVGVGLRYDTDQSTDHRYERINKTLTRHIFKSIILLYLFKDILYDTTGKVVHLVSADMPTRVLTM